MVIKTEICTYSEYRIFPGRGIRYVQKDGRTQFFINHKMDSLFKQRIKPVKLTWTINWRRKNKKGRADDAGKKRTRKAAKVQKAIVGMSLDDIKRKRAQKPELRAAARESAMKEHKERAKKAADAKKTTAKAAPKKAAAKQAPVKAVAKKQ